MTTYSTEFRRDDGQYTRIAMARPHISEGFFPSVGDIVTDAEQKKWEVKRRLFDYDHHTTTVVFYCWKL